MSYLARVSLAEPLPPAPSNAEPYSVSELAFALKRTLEDAYGHVRLRGEVSKVTRHASGHVYLTIKDDRASIDGVIWKSVRGISIRPETGMEVIVSGKITTYPARSSYQLVIETLEPAGVGALLAQLERLKGRLAEEGLFAPERKRPLPALPAVIGVVTSPTGAVIRDILHRVRERWPCRVVVWPVVVQGEAASAQVAAAVRGFDALAPGGPVPRPDLLIVARGGGSVEDLWPFNDEALARAVAACTLPVISAVGHETDTTLIDFVSDRRAPTPTAAAEMATPVLADLIAQTADAGRRMHRCASHGVDRARERLRAAERGLPRPDALLAVPAQRFDLASRGLTTGLARNVAVHERAFAGVGGRLNQALLERPRRLKTERLADLAARLRRSAARIVPAAAERARLPALTLRADTAVARRLDQAAERLGRLEQLRRSLNPDAPLARGFARVQGADGRLVRAAAALSPAETVTLIFANDRIVATVADKGVAPRALGPPTEPRAPKRRDNLSSQGELF
jgi:exodeoxyribonuclease VII large subunit